METTQMGSPHELASRLRAAREEAGLSRERLAVAAGLSSATLGRIEAGGYRPRLASLEALAAALGTTAAELLATDDEPEAAAL